jgi:hypothetical protein
LDSYHGYARTTNFFAHSFLKAKRQNNIPIAQHIPLNQYINPSEFAQQRGTKLTITIDMELRQGCKPDKRTTN